jgi:hypothetical protein
MVDMYQAGREPAAKIAIESTIPGDVKTSLVIVDVLAKYLIHSIREYWKTQPVWKEFSEDEIDTACQEENDRRGKSEDLTISSLSSALDILLNGGMS